MASIPQAPAARPSQPFTGRNGLLDRYFYFAMSLAAAAIVVDGFGERLGARLLHPAIPLPRIIWFHAAVFSSWIVFFILQSALIRGRNIKLHRLIGWFGAGVAAIMFPLGVATAIVMAHFEVYRLHEHGRYAFLAVPFFSIGSFAVCAALAIWWRKKPEFHRRLIFFATCAVLVAAFARVDHSILGIHRFQFFAADLLIALGIGRDLLVNRRVHVVYKVALPVYIVAQLFVVYISRTGPEWWLHIAHAIVG